MECQINDELFKLTRRQQERSAENDCERLRCELVTKQSDSRWLKLRGRLVYTLANLNIRANSGVLRWDDAPNPLRIWGKERAVFTFEYNRKFHVARFGSSLERRGKEYELTVRIVDGNDAVVWIDNQNGQIKTEEEIVTSMVCYLLRSLP